LSFGGAGDGFDPYLTVTYFGGTEKMLVEFGKANFIDKARQQPDKVRMVLDKVKADGLLPTLEAVRNKLDQPLPSDIAMPERWWKWERV